MNPRAQDAAQALLHRHSAITSAGTFSLLGMEWDLLPGVYAPHLTRSAALYAEWVPYPVGGSFCEVGCGTGYIAVTAALRGCSRVAALDISAAAVRNTQLNAIRHGVAERVQARCGDLFAPLAPGDRYDVVFWNSNFVETDDETACGELESAFFDPGYRTHAAFLASAGDHLAQGGQLLLGFTDLGSPRRLARLVEAHGWRAHVTRAVRCATPAGSIAYQLVALHSRRHTNPERTTNA